MNTEHEGEKGLEKATDLVQKLQWHRVSLSTPKSKRCFMASKDFNKNVLKNISNWTNQEGSFLTVKKN